MKTTSETVYVGTHNLAAIVSRITNRRIYLNNSTFFGVPPTFSNKRVKSAREVWKTYVDETMARKAYVKAYRYPDAAKSSWGLYKKSVELINECLTSATEDAFQSSVEALITRILAVEQKAADSDYAPGTDRQKQGRRAGESKRLIEALVVMWQNGLLLFPASELWNSFLLPGQSIAHIDPTLFGAIGLQFAQMLKPVRWSGRRPLILLPTTIGNLVEIGDIDEQVMEELKHFAPVPAGNSVYSVCDQILAEQRRIYGLVSTIPQSYRNIFASRVSVRSDPEFAWAAERGGERLRDWTVSAADYLGKLTNRVGIRYEVTHFNPLLDYVISDESIPARPVDFCRRDFQPRQSILDYLMTATSMGQNGISSTLRTIARYFESVLKARACNEHGEMLRGFRNPIELDDIPRQTPPKGKTDRNAMPIRFVRLLTEIIEGPYIDGQPTFEWPKTLRSDYFSWVDPVTGCKQDIWSPIRANCFLLLLKIPIRGLQARLLDSGEADTEVYRPSEGGWLRNSARLAPGDNDEKRAIGLLRRIWDADTGRWFNGLYITTNKTADRKDMFANTGYEIPWENNEVIDIYCRLRDWQEKHNPCIRPLSRAEIKSDKNMLVSEDVAERLDKLCFLFRDAADPRYPQEPITVGRMAVFWRNLIDELEKRLKKSNERNRDGSDIKIVETRSESGEPRAVLFDIHSLRVTGLTSLISAGVPIHILSEFVAGHATILMTLYYYKPGAAKVTEILDQATKLISEQDDWEYFLNNHSSELIHDISVYNSEEGRRAATQTQSALWSILDEGVCPNGGSLCQIGGPLISKKGKAYASVPGGKRNCVLCRFFVTGPRYLPGLAAKFNANGGLIREKCLRHKQAETNRRELMATLSSTRNLDSSMRDQLRAADEAIEGIEAEIDSLSKTFVAQKKCIERIKNIINERLRQDAKAEDALVLNGGLLDFEVSMKECSEFDLWDRICRSADVYPSIDPALPSIRRARLLDAMLTRNGKTAAFATFTDQQLQYVGNAWTAHLRAILGEAALIGLIEGTCGVQELGIDAEIDALLASNIESPIRIGSLPLPLASNSVSSRAQITTKN